MTICKEYILILKEADKNKKQIKSFFNQLKKGKKDKQINVLFQQYHEEIFEEIDCLKCANCCSTVGPMISDLDIRKMSGALGVKPSKVVTDYLRIDEDDDYVFKSMPCPFLNQNDHYCNIYDSRPKACREYPHTDHRKITRILNITYKNTFLCPAVYLIVKRVDNEMFKALKSK